MKIGLVGYRGSGKSTLFELLTGVAPDASLAHATQSAMAPVPDPRFEPLFEVYRPKKRTHAALEIVDTPGLSRTHEGNAGRLAMIREAGCLVHVVAAFDGSDLNQAIRGFDEDLLLADLDIVVRRIERLEEQLKKPRPDRDQLKTERAALEPLAELLESGTSLRQVELNDEQARVIKAFQLFAYKPRLVIVNVADDEAEPQRFTRALPDGTPVMAVPVGLESELARMEPDEREQFRSEMDIPAFDRDVVIRALMEASGQMLYFTAGPKELRSWIIRQGSTALEAADAVHSDLARGFIRAEVIRSEDLLRLGSEREVKAHNLMRKEPKDYVVQDGDILLIQFSV